MYIPFSEEFEYEFESNTYYVQSTGYREVDDEGHEYTEVSNLIVTDEAGNDVEKNTDAFLDIEEYVTYDRNYEVEQHGFPDEWQDEEEVPFYQRSN